MNKTLLILGAGLLSTVSVTGKTMEKEMGIQIPSISENDFDCFGTEPVKQNNNNVASSNSCGNVASLAIANEGSGVAKSNNDDCSSTPVVASQGCDASGIVNTSAFGNSNSVSVGGTSITVGSNNNKSSYGGNVQAEHEAFNDDDDCGCEDEPEPEKYEIVNGQRVQSAAYTAWLNKKQSNNKSKLNSNATTIKGVAKVAQNASKSAISASKQGHLKDEEGLASKSAIIKKKAAKDNVQRGFKRQNEEKGINEENECVENGEMNLGFENSGNRKLIDNVSGCEEKIVHEEVVKDCNCNEKVNRKVWLKKHLDKKHLRQEDGLNKKDTTIRQAGANKNGVMRKHRSAGQGARYHSDCDENDTFIDTDAASKRNELTKSDFENFGKTEAASDSNQSNETLQNAKACASNSEDNDAQGTVTNTADVSNSNNRQQQDVTVPIQVIKRPRADTC